jgi:hypothetical protein
VAGTLQDALASAGFVPPAEAKQEKDERASAPVVEENGRPSPELERLLREGLVTGSVVGISKHAVERFRQRFEPDCDFGEAKRRLYMRLHRAVYFPERPSWLVHVGRTKADVRNVGYLDAGHLSVSKLVSRSRRRGGMVSCRGDFRA